jgi:uncharacterized protein
MSDEPSQAAPLDRPEAAPSHEAPAQDAPAAPIPPPIPTSNPVGAPANDGRNWAAVAHLSAFLGYASIPLGFVLGPLIVWAALKDKYAFVDEQGKEALNFQLSMLIYTLASIPLICLCVGIMLLVLIHVANFVFIIVAAVRAANGEHYRYPLAIRFLK